MLKRWEVVGYSTAGWGMVPHLRSRHVTHLGARWAKWVADRIGLGVGPYEIRRRRA